VSEVKEHLFNKEKIDKNLIVESIDGQSCQGLFTKEKSSKGSGSIMGQIVN